MWNVQTNVETTIESAHRAVYFAQSTVFQRYCVMLALKWMVQFTQGETMAELSLREYLAELDRLLQAHAADDIILHSRHLLQYYPKVVDAYRYLGRALLMNGRWDEAEAALRRVLSVIPDDFHAHLGLSEIYDTKRRGDEAIWHLERAMEVDPSRRELADSMRSLYKRYRNIDQARIPQTAGGVARQAMANHSYEQAIETLRSALARYPDRTDLRLLLAESYWEGGDPVEAAEAASDVLDLLPDCLVANRIMTSLWLQEDRPSDAQQYLSRIEAVDPYLAVELATNAPVDDDTFHITALDVKRTAQSELSANRPDWLSDITADDAAQQTADEWSSFDPSRSGLLASTRRDAEPPPEAPQPAFDASSFDVSPSDLSSSSSQDLPDWMNAATTAVPIAPLAAEVPDEDPLGWLNSESSQAEELPSDDILFADAFARDAAVPAPAESGSSAGDWLADFPDVIIEEPEPASQFEQVDVDALFASPPPQDAPKTMQPIAAPDWKSDDAFLDEAFGIERMVQETPGAEPEPEPLDWLNALPTEEPTDTDADVTSLEIPAARSESSSGLTGVLDDIRFTDSESDSAGEDLTASDDQWLEEVSNEPAGVPGPKRGLTAMLQDANLEWMSESATSPEVDAAMQAADDDWMRQFDPAGKRPTGDEPGWLNELSDEAATETSEPADETATDMPTAVIPTVTSRFDDTGEALELESGDEPMQDERSAGPTGLLATAGLAGALALSQEPDDLPPSLREEPQPDWLAEVTLDEVEPAADFASAAAEPELDWLADASLAEPTDAVAETPEAVAAADADLDALFAQPEAAEAVIDFMEPAPSEGQFEDETPDAEGRFIPAAAATALLGGTAILAADDDRAAPLYDPFADIEEPAADLLAAQPELAAEVHDTVHSAHVTIDDLVPADWGDSVPQAAAKAAADDQVLESDVNWWDSEDQSEADAQQIQPVADSEAQPEGAVELLADAGGDWFFDPVIEAVDEAELAAEMPSAEEGWFEDAPEGVMMTAEETPTAEATLVGVDTLHLSAESGLASEWLGEPFEESVDAEMVSAELLAESEASDTANPLDDSAWIVTDDDAVEPVAALAEDESPFDDDGEDDALLDTPEDEPADDAWITAEGAALAGGAGAVIALSLSDTEDEAAESALDLGDDELAMESNAPDWLNAMVPGLDVDYEAEEDRPIETDFIAAEPADVIGHDDATGGGFTWVEQMVAQEQRATEMALANGYDPLARYPFTVDPAWVRALKSLTDQDPPADGADSDLPEWLR